MFGLFLENGPLRISKGPGDDDWMLSPADKAWTDDYNIIFLDQPVNTGFSYGDTSLTDMDTGAVEFLSFLDQFFAMYPEFKERDFHLTGESYAGKYLPLFAFHILERNKHQPELEIKLKSTQIGDPFPSPAIQRQNMYLVAKGLNTVDDNNLD